MPKNGIVFFVKQSDPQNTPLSHTPGIPFHPPDEKNSFHNLLVRGLGYVPLGCPKKLGSKVRISGL